MINMKVVLVSLMLLLAFIAIDCSPFEETEKIEAPDEVDEEIYRNYLNWKVKQPQDSDNSFERFLESTSTKIKLRELSDNKYTVYVQTGNQMHAGTNAHVRIQLFGSKGESAVIRLNTWRDDFERGNTDTFHFYDRDVGDISRIWIGHDNHGLGAGWFLDKVTVRDDARNKDYVFPCYEWLSQKYLSRVLYVS